MFVSREDPRAVVATAPYTPGRLRSASRIPIRRTDNPREFYVKSRSRKGHWWAVNLDGDPMCYCEDNEHATRQCSHVLAARMASGDLSLLQALGDMLAKQEERTKELERGHRKGLRGKARDALQSQRKRDRAHV